MARPGSARDSQLKVAMRHFAFYAVTIALLTAQVQGQSAPPARASTGWAYTVHSIPVNPRGALILLPGFGTTFGDFSDFLNATTPRLPLADSLARHGIAVVFIGPPAGVLFGGPTHVEELENTISEALHRVTDHAVPLAIGGFSAGGTDAILLAERCGRGDCRMQHPVRAVFEVDSPLDWFRAWDNATLTLTNPPPRANVAEARMVRDALEARMGSHPAPTTPTYLEASPLAARAPDGGNARALTRIAVRAYTEPDVAWWMANRDSDYYGMNALDAASLVRHLHLLGNTEAALITTTGKGFRADGTRHPHSWSIVDQADLAKWVVAHLGLR